MKRRISHKPKDSNPAKPTVTRADLLHDLADCIKNPDGGMSNRLKKAILDGVDSSSELQAEFERNTGEPTETFRRGLNHLEPDQ